MNALTLNLDSIGLADEQFEQIAATNRNLRLERTAKGELVIMPPLAEKPENATWI